MDDERLLAELGDAVRSGGQVPAGFLAAGRAAFAWRDPDAELAVLTGGEPAGVRSGSDDRVLSFTAGALRIEAEVADGALLGQIAPPQRGRVVLQSRDGTVAETEADDLGWFAVRPVPAGMFRLSFSGTSGVRILTEWVSG